MSEKVYFNYGILISRDLIKILSWSKKVGLEKRVKSPEAENKDN
jgi:hypothetical protein